jgi:hypothetical protein
MMTEQQLNEALGELRKEIEQLEIGDQAAKERLASLLENIEQNLDFSGDIEAHQDMIEEMREALTHFEVEHPRITGILGEIMMALSNMGI